MLAVPASMKLKFIAEDGGDTDEGSEDHAEEREAHYTGIVRHRRPERGPCGTRAGDVPPYLAGTKAATLDTMDAGLAHRAQATFALLGPALFPMHGPRNWRLDVEVMDTGPAGDALTFIVVLPWGFEGLIFAPDDRFPTSLVLGGRRLQVFHHELPDLGRFQSVQLVENVTPLASPRHARKVAWLIAPSFRDAVARARQELFAA